MPSRPCFLGVSQSLNGRRWVLRPSDERTALALSQRLGLPEVAGRVLAGRGVGLDEAEDFLNPTLKNLLPDPSSLQDMDVAVARLVRAVREGQTIGVFGDYDVDGATSTAVLVRFFSSLGLRVLTHIPDRQAEGYGPNLAALKSLKERGAGVVITVDCGITAFVPLEEAEKAGVEVIVVDHHEAEPKLPASLAAVNPNRLDDTSGQGHLAAVGVTFLLVVALNRALRQAGWYGAGRAEPDLMQWLDLVALGTVCDVVPLRGLNRALVTQGLKVLGQRRNVGLKALSEIAAIDEPPTAYHLGFILGPRINAGGRVGQASLGANLLTCDDPAQALEMARRLEAYNAERRELEAAILLEAIEQVERDPDPDQPFVFAASAAWHPGVVGIVASRLKDRYAMPSCVAAIEGGLVKGSGRSVRGVDLGSVIIAARQSGLLVAGGGHAMAAGFTVEESRLDEFRAFMTERLRAFSPEGGFAPTLEVDGVVGVTGATPDLVEALSKIGPFGAGNAEPRFVVAEARVLKADVVGMGHVRCELSGVNGGRLKAIAFRSVDSELGLTLLNGAGRTLHLAGTLKSDTWKGRNDVQMFIEDAAPAGV